MIKELKTYDWKSVLRLGNNLGEFNDEQWRFLKALIIELATEKYSNSKLKYVGAKHKDFDSVSGHSVELKSQFSETFYKNNGQLRKTFNVKFNNSMGTNNNDVLPDDHVCDYLILMRRDGVCLIDRKTIMKKSVKKGDGFMLVLEASDLVEITGKVKVDDTVDLELKGKIMNFLRSAI